MGARSLRFGIVAVLVLADLWSKAGVFAAVEGASDLIRDSHGHLRMHVLGENIGWFTFMRSLNPGAAFGRFASMPHLLVGGRVVAVIFLSVLLYRSPKKRHLFTTALVLVLAGALGNLYDNLFMGNLAQTVFGSSTDEVVYGKVRDFIDVYFATWDAHFPTFNVADSCISVGAVVLLLTGLKSEESAEAPENGEAGSLEAGA